MIAGLSLPQKALPPKYFYDAAGSRLFERICRLREYYPTRVELALTRANLADIARFAGRRVALVEYGSGESLKTRLLLRALRPEAYIPIDISEDALAAAERRLRREFPWLALRPVQGDFSRPLAVRMDPARGGRTVVYFPGSTIGNLTPEDAHAAVAGDGLGEAARIHDRGHGEDRHPRRLLEAPGLAQLLFGHEHAELQAVLGGQRAAHAGAVQEDARLGAAGGRLQGGTVHGLRARQVELAFEAHVQVAGALLELVADHTPIRPWTAKRCLASIQSFAGRNPARRASARNSSALYL